MPMLLFALTMLMTAWHAESVLATEQIRVLLVPQTPAVTVKSDQGVLLRSPKTAERAVSMPVRITAGRTGMLINGVRVDTTVARFRARHGDVTLTIGHPIAQARDQAPKSARRASRAGGSMRHVPVAGSLLHTLVVPGIVDVVYRGGVLSVINELDLEEYVKGVVPSEMSAAWHLEALKVQAVAARTYALYQKMLNDGREYDVVAGIQDQVYRGRQGVDQRVHEVVDATRGLVMVYQNAPILAAFSSTAAGPTEDAMIVWSKDLPYLKGVDCPFDQSSPYYQWRVQFTVDELERSLRKQGMTVGTIATLTPSAHSRAGRVDKIRILHSQGELIVRGQDFRRAVGYSVVPSTQFEIETLGRDIVLAGKGSGHAVGLCQWGAKELAEQGYTYVTILRYYFPGTELKRSVGLERPPLPPPIP